jgi:hypothetical protein
LVIKGDKRDMKITLATLLEGVEYTPVPGNEYEIAEGVWGTLRPPTKALVDEVTALTEQETVDHIALAKKVLTPTKPFTEDKAIVGMTTMVIQDFFTCYATTAERLNARSQPVAPSEATA